MRRVAKRMCCTAAVLKRKIESKRYKNTARNIRKAHGARLIQFRTLYEWKMFENPRLAQWNWADVILDGAFVATWKRKWFNYRVLVVDLCADADDQPASQFLSILLDLCSLNLNRYYVNAIFSPDACAIMMIVRSCSSVQELVQHHHATWTKSADWIHWVKSKLTCLWAWCGSIALESFELVHTASNWIVPTKRSCFTELMSLEFNIFFCFFLFENQIEVVVESIGGTDPAVHCKLSVYFN